MVTGSVPMALYAVKTTLERALDKDLSDLVRGIRAHKDNEVSIKVYSDYILDQVHQRMPR